MRLKALLMAAAETAPRSRSRRACVAPSPAALALAVAVAVAMTVASATASDVHVARMVWCVISNSKVSLRDKERSYLFIYFA